MITDSVHMKKTVYRASIVDLFVHYESITLISEVILDKIHFLVLYLLNSMQCLINNVYHKHRQHPFLCIDEIQCLMNLMLIDYLAYPKPIKVGFFIRFKARIVLHRFIFFIFVCSIKKKNYFYSYMWAIQLFYLASGKDIKTIVL